MRMRITLLRTRIRTTGRVLPTKIIVSMVYHHGMVEDYGREVRASAKAVSFKSAKNCKELESGNIKGATYNRQVERSKVSMVVKREGLTL